MYRNKHKNLKDYDVIYINDIDQKIEIEKIAKNYL